MEAERRRLSEDRQSVYLDRSSDALQNLENEHLDSLKLSRTTIIRRESMGFTSVKVTIANPKREKKVRQVELLVDTGALYSVIPREVLEQLGIQPKMKLSFTLASGAKIRREIGGAVYTFDGRLGYAPVVFGERRDKALLGVTALEALGLEIDHTKQKLRPAELYLL